LIPAVRADRLDGSADWPVEVFEPRWSPLESLAVALSGVRAPGAGVADLQQTIAAMRAEPRTLHQESLLALRDGPPSRRLVVVVDQFEEAFTLCTDEGVRRAFLANLVAAATAEGGRTLVVLTVRADLYGRCAEDPGLAAAGGASQELVGAMSEGELRRAIQEPARRVGCEVEPALVEVLVREAAGRDGALPLLADVLLDLWGEREVRRLTLAKYRELGELRGALK